MNTKTVLSRYPAFMGRWKKYKKQFPDVKNWFISSDYCFDKNKYNQVITFTICPSVDIKWLDSQLRQDLPKDIKHLTHISDKMIYFLKSNYFFFSISFIIKGKCELLIDNLKKSLPKWIKQLEINNKVKYHKQIKRYKLLQCYLTQKSYNKKLVSNLCLTATSLASIIEFLIIKYDAKKILWISDRDDMLGLCEGVIINITQSFYNGLLNGRKKENILFGVTKENSKTNTFEFDALIRYPDVISGIISSVDFERNICDKAKHFDLFVNAVADNARIQVFQINDGFLRNSYEFKRSDKGDDIIRAHLVPEI
ncbi:hypothetical protein [Candidatus Avelusimicrobium stercoris]|uniref:hypothetical protein n=1 Tax=Candidatus Avelusimicrobium stercoris TaxID=1947924 RepID=UPI003D137F2B